jgi:UDPglucose 6-dehydrogenase
MSATGTSSRRPRGTARPRLSVIGTGYLGTAHAACLAELGFQVLGVDTDPGQIAALAAGQPPLCEPGLTPMVRRGLRSGRLAFSTSFIEAAAFADVHFLCVGTPQLPGQGAADLSQLFGCVDSLAPLLDRPCLVVGKSTTPVGTAERLATRIARSAPAGERAELAWNPEFLREGHAVTDTLRPDRIVAGVQSARAEAVVREVYADLLRAGTPLVITDFATAELVKMAANAYLATKISFINAMAELCEAAGGDAVSLSRALGHDPRIGAASLWPGLGFGGGCLPKDIRAFLVSAAELGASDSLGFLEHVDAINLRCRSRAVDAAAALAGGSLQGRVVGVLGAAFKPGTDDIRDSPALSVAAQIHHLGGQVTLYDPAATDRARQAHPELRYAGSAVGAATDAEVLLVLTDWAEFTEADPELLGKAVARRNVLDARNALDPQRWRAAGWTYRALGRQDGAQPRGRNGAADATSGRRGGHGRRPAPAA